MLSSVCLAFVALIDSMFVCGTKAAAIFPTAFHCVFNSLRSELGHYPLPTVIQIKE